MRASLYVKPTVAVLEQIRTRPGGGREQGKSSVVLRAQAAGGGREGRGGKGNGGR